MPEFIMLAREPSIEPYGLHCLAEVPRQAGWDSKVVLVKNNDFGPFYNLLNKRKSDTMVGIHIWAGYHKPLLKEAERIRSMGIPLVMGGPFATYSPERCAPHADWVVKASGYGLLRKILDGQLPKGIHFDPLARKEETPVPQRDIIYNDFPQFADSLVKSCIGGEGCPYHCTYCHAPENAEMHGGFENIRRQVSRIIEEAHIILKRWPLHTIYFQDDIFGFDEKVWLVEFARRWKEEVGVPFHCQLRLEMVKGESGDRRLELLAKAGCTGITLAIESDSEFLRNHVLDRPMQDALIVAGCRKIMDLGMELRTEQILAVPFSNIATDLGTLGLNVRIKPTMAWTSILSPYPGVPIGEMAKNFKMWEGDYDDLEDSFLSRSIMKHVAGPEEIAKIISLLPRDQQNKALLRMSVVKNGGDTADVFYQHVKRERIGGVPTTVKVGEPERVGTITYLSEAENEQYRDDSVFAQRFFIPLARMPEGEKLGHDLVALKHNQRDWKSIGEVTETHLRKHVSASTLEGDRHALAQEMGFESPEMLHEVVAQNPHYFTRFKAGGTLAKKVVDMELFGPKHTTGESLDLLGRETRHHSFAHELYKFKHGPNAIAA